MLISDMPYPVSQQIRGFEKVSHEADVCIVGGGMAGMIAAISAARHGAKVVLVHERPVLGGNASSEIRMWICGARGNKEAGVLEEIQLENCYRNPTQVYSIWDNVLYEKVAFCPGIKLLLNASCNGGTMEHGRLATIGAWQMTTQTWHTIRAKYFIDCSGDSVLAPISGAEVRVGRESREEFDEDIQPATADDRTMGNSLLIQARETDQPQPYIAPKWAYKYRSVSDLPNRWVMGRGDNFWWIEVGGLQNTIRDAEDIRHELMKIGTGIWDYIKNHWEKRNEFENWGLEWFGSLPGKRENRRYVGDHILTQKDVRDGGRFKDMVAYGGWSMDDHHPAGLYYPGKPTIFHPAPSPFGIPYRSLYSRNVPNLFCAGRNISCTHAALSSVRVMGTTSLMGQAAGTAAALCTRHKCEPRELYPSRMDELQSMLMDDDQWLPGMMRGVSSLTRSARIGGSGTGLDALRDGQDRPAGETSHQWQGTAGDAIELSWNEPTTIGGVRLVFDSNLNHMKRMPCSYPLKGNRCGVPESMIRQYSIEAQNQDGSWSRVYRETNNYQRLVRLPLDVRARAIRFVPETTWGAAEMRLFSLDALQEAPQPIGHVEEGKRWPERVAEIPAKDLAAPESGLEATDGRKKVGA